MWNRNRKSPPQWFPWREQIRILITWPRATRMRHPNYCRGATASGASGASVLGPRFTSRLGVSAQGLGPLVFTPGSKFLAQVKLWLTNTNFWASVSGRKKRAPQGFCRKGFQKPNLDFSPAQRTQYKRPAHVLLNTTIHRKRNVRIYLNMETLCQYWHFARFHCYWQTHVLIECDRHVPLNLVDFHQTLK